MSISTGLKDRFSTAKSHLTSLDNQPLGKAALVIILFLDLFILIAIFNGLGEHTRQLTAPEEYIPYTCREIVVDRSWNSTNRIDNLSQIITASSGSYSYRPATKLNERHRLCAPYLDLLEQIKQDKTLVGIFEERTKAERETQELQRRINQLKGAYDTSLLETIARQPEPATEVDATRGEFKQKSSSLNSLKSRINALEETINADPKVAALCAKLQTSQITDRQTLLSDLRHLNFWFPVKKLGMQLLFLLPLFTVFYLWNSASIKHNRGLQTLVSSHLLGVSFIPIFCKLIETVYDIIPKKLLKTLIDLLESLKLVAIWHYLVMALAIAAALFLIYIFQKKLFSHEKLIERRIAKGECQQCGKHLPDGAKACPFCGAAQFKPCGQCAQPMHAHGRFCQQCGTPSHE